jgi:predicted metal-dependent enzyme (double-stranded beta helix superfamily)
MTTRTAYDLDQFVSSVVWGPGDRVGPHDHQTRGLIGVMDNDSDRATVEIHVYGKDLVELPRYRYDLATDRVIPFASKKFDNC